MKAASILDTIGGTPHVKINRLFGNRVDVWMKLERANPGGSIKDRIALAMIEDAETKGLLSRDSVIVEPTSGNTGIGLALVAAVRGYRLMLVMPESMSVERRRCMAALGAELVLTPRQNGMPGAIEKAKQILAETPNSWMPQQFENEANARIHRNTTAQEIIADFGAGIDCLISGVGTGGHISGVAEALKTANPNLKVFAVEPEASAVLSGGQPAPHPIQGIGAGFVPKILNRNILDGIIQVSKDEAYEFARRSAREEGIFVGISSGATLAATAKKIGDLPERSTVLIFCYDSGERYLSVDGLFAT